MTSGTPIQGIADTARWVALYRAEETERRDAHFRDPWARRLAGELGAQIHRQLPRSARRAGWSFVARTVLFDQIVQDEVAGGATFVINLAAGLDTRPYRLPLPPTLRWIEVDQPELLAEKATLLADASPRCQLERVSLNLTAEDLRQDYFQQWAALGSHGLILTEGLLIYLTDPQVGSLARALAAQTSFRSWATDLTSPGLLRIIQKDWGRQLAAAGAPVQFAPVTGPAFFGTFGWEPLEIHPLLTTARRLRRLPAFLRLLSRLPGAGSFHPRRPWSAVCLLTQQPHATPAK